MIKQSKLVYVIGSIVIGIITIIAVVAGLMLSGVIDASSHKLVFISKSEEIVYTGQALVCNEYEIESARIEKRPNRRFRQNFRFTDNFHDTDNSRKRRILDQCDDFV